MSFPQRHPLCGPGASTSYDYVVGLETQGAQVSLIGPSLATLLSRDPTNIGLEVSLLACRERDAAAEAVPRRPAARS